MSTKEKKLTIIKDNEFRLFVNEYIDQDDVFLEQYERAAAMLNEIIGDTIGGRKGRENRNDQECWNDCENWKKREDCKGYGELKDHEYENNIIAFCGGRGEGKSSAMTTFVNAVCKFARGSNYGNSEFLDKYKNIGDIYLADPIIIDPSTFDDVHNVLDIVLAKIFRNFDKECTGNDGYADLKGRERMLDLFQKVYKCVSLINNQTKMLDDEFDYEGNIGKLSKLGESTDLKRKLKELVSEYLNFMEKCRNNDGNKKRGYLIIAIDDLDLCSSSAYKMAEQIRKYLIIPQVIIVMAVRIEQLKLCVEEKNRNDFERLLKSESAAQITEEVKIMADRYVSKLIPIARRVYLPSVQELIDTQIAYRESMNGTIIWESSNIEETRQNNSYKLVQPILDLIYKKTGMRFLPEQNGESFLLPYNLRDMINLIVMLVNMEDAVKDNVIEDDICYQNIRQFRRYYEREWIGNLPDLDIISEMQAMTSMDADSLHFNTYQWLEEIFKESGRRSDDRSFAVIEEALYTLSGVKVGRSKNFYEIVEWFEVFNKSIYDTKGKRYSYGFRILYTIRLNELLRQKNYDGISLLLNGYIWGKRFTNILPAAQNTKLDRTRFKIETNECFEGLFTSINGNLDEASLTDSLDQVSLIPVENIEKNILPWTLLGLLANACKDGVVQNQYSPEGIIIYNNYSFVTEVQVSLENYFVGMVNLEKIYDKVNMSQLGIKEDKFKAKVEEWERYNKESIDLIRKIVTNVDVILELKDYCIKNNDYRERTDGERTKKLVEKFFDNIVEFMKSRGFTGDIKKLRYFHYGNSEGEAVDVSKVYAKLFDVYVLQQKQKGSDELMQEFVSKLTKASEARWWRNNYEKVASYLVTRTAKNAKRNLDALAMNANRLLSEHDIRLDMNMIDRLVEYYEIIIEVYQQDDEEQLSHDLLEEYKVLMREIERIDIKYLGR